MKPLLLILLLLTKNHFLFSQQQAMDSSELLQEVFIRAYEQNRKLKQVPAAVASISNTQLNRFNNTTILPAMNSNPGIRMEERSPGSYRLNIRGSSLRSPFGVRNVKVYYNHIPYTDPGGNTYLNQLGFYNFHSIEVIKGPGSSLYGAGTGGVVLINTDQPAWHAGLGFDVYAGQFNTHGLNTNLRVGTDNVKNTINYMQLSSDGYRNHTELDRKIFTWDVSAGFSEKGNITAHFLWGDLFYETPGALTQAEYLANPKMARPRVGQTPGAEENKAAIYQEIFLAGLSVLQKFDEHWQNITSFYGAATKLRNPTTRNYGRTSEPHTGGRSLIQYTSLSGAAVTLTAIGGVEFQQGNSSVRIYSNRDGNPDTLQTDDEINNRLFSVFMQTTMEFRKNWLLTAGVSLNSQNIIITRLSAIPPIEQKRKYNNEMAPRLAVLKQITSNVSAYASIARGYSPPTTAELLPSSGIISTSLDAENGTNTEAGIRGSLVKGKLYFDINAFHFALNSTIVQRRDAGGADYFVNAGSTRQNGIESHLSYLALYGKKKGISRMKFWISHTWHHFTYKNFKQLTNDFSGNRLPSVAPHVVVAGVDMHFKPGFYTHLTWYYSDPVPLNDANSETAASFNLLSGRLGWKKNIHPKVQLHLYTAADNIFDVQYSLGNDINGFGGRYYNAAPGFNFSGGISLQFHFN